jgi:hypothetical protein
MTFVDTIETIFEDIKSFEEKLEKTLKEEKRLLANFIYETPDQLIEHFDYNYTNLEGIIDDCAIINLSINDSQEGLSKCATLIKKITKVVNKSQNELNNKNRFPSLQTLAQQYINTNPNKFKRREREEKAVKAVLNLNQREQILDQQKRANNEGSSSEGGGKCKTKKRYLGRKHKIRCKTQSKR